MALDLHDNWKLISIHTARLLQAPCDKSRDETSNSIRDMKDWFPDGIESLWMLITSLNPLGLKLPLLQITHICLLLALPYLALGTIVPTLKLMFGG